jgi:catechol 2,3-dioxygenase-like lactoylglutathione lyase family enzyme
VFAESSLISAVTSLEAVKGFYGDVLGLRPVMDHG